jgi:hypothetical protein
MSVKIKNFIIPALLIAITIPFVLQTDLFPFLRFGMFAEPIQPQTEFETFEVSYVDRSNKEVIVSSKSFGIEKHFFPYLARNHYYRNESDLFLKKISDILPDTNIVEWRLKKIEYPNNNPQNKDTVLIRLNLNEKK